MKKIVLIVSASACLSAALVAILATVFSSSPEVLARSLACAGYLVTLSIGTFFVGLASPKE